MKAIFRFYCLLFYCISISTHLLLWRTERIFALLAGYEAAGTAGSLVRSVLKLSIMASRLVSCRGKGITL